MPRCFQPSIVAASLGTTRESVISGTQGPVVDPRYRPDERNSIFMSAVEFMRSKAPFIERNSRVDRGYEVLPGGRIVYKPGHEPARSPVVDAPHIEPRVSFGDRPFDPIMAGHTGGWRLGR